MRKMSSNSFPGLLVNNKQRKKRDGQSVSLTENVCSASVKSNCAVPPPSRANSWALASLFSLDGKFPVAGTFEMSNAPQVGTKKEGKCRVLNPHCSSFHWPRGRIMVWQLMSAFVIALFLLSRDKPFIIFLLWKFAARKCHKIEINNNVWSDLFWIV